jgi:MFS superfamily sulfate permease-like transporter
MTGGLYVLPQALAYGTVAGLSPMSGVYSIILPTAVYVFYGSQMQVCVGPVILVSLLMGNLITSYNVSYATQPTLALDTAAQAGLSVGIILMVMSVLNLGNLINYISHPVMTGFTTAAAWVIGLILMANAFGFSNNPPKPGQPGYEYNWKVMQWYTQNWNGRYGYPGVKKLSAAQFNSNGLLYRNPLACQVSNTCAVLM